ncbi:FtsK/SpoIIIE domain-containing protein [Streptomyces sp. NPDC046876]|uniref:FtsK/SpoIIIE domain-containing protein n=1 Tax=Streptomyces sp. NPDC046876 TaxID=3155616 RepID=UPI0033C5489A
MQIRLTVLGSRSGHQTVPAGCDVLVTAPAGTALAAVASGLAATVGGPDTGGTVVLYAGAERLDPQRALLGEPPLVDGAVLGLHGPVPDVAPEGADGVAAAGAQLHVVAGPDAGGVHLLHPGAIRIGRSADADIPLDDPDVSRLHCAVTVREDGRVAVADLESTNGTTVDGTEVGTRPVALAPGALLRVGETTLRLAGGCADRLPAVPDHEGHLCLPAHPLPDTPSHPAPAPARPAGPSGPVGPALRPGLAGPAGHAGTQERPGSAGPADPDRADAAGPTGFGAGPAAPAEAGRAGAARTAGSGIAGPAGAQAGSAAYGAGTRQPMPPAAGTAGSVGAAGAGSGGPGAAGGAPAGHGLVGTVGAGGYGSAGAAVRGHGAAGAAGGAGAPAVADGGEAYAPGGAGGGQALGAVRGHGAAGTAGAAGAGSPGAAVPGHGAAGAAGDTGVPAAAGGGEAQAARGRNGGGQALGATAGHGSAGAAVHGHGATGAAAGQASGPVTGGGQAPGHGFGGSQGQGPAGGQGQGRTGGGHGQGPVGESQGQGPLGGGQGESPAGGSQGQSPAGGQGQGRTGGGHGQGQGRTGGGPGQSPVGGGRGATGEGQGRAGGGWRRGGFGAWARRWVRGEAEGGAEAPGAAAVAAVPDVDDPAALLLAALGPTRRLWSREPGRLEVGLGAGSRVALQDVGGLGLAGPRPRLDGVARSLVAQLAALHAPAQLEIVLISSDRARPVERRREGWAWLGWLPHVRPAHGQDCRLLLAYDTEQAAARTGELTRRLDEGPLGATWAAADRRAVREAAAAHRGPYTLLVVDGEPGTAALRDLTGRLASHGPAAGIHVLVLAETASATPASPLTDTYEAACAATPAFRDCGAAALLSGDVATTVRTFAVTGGRPVTPGTTATADAVSAAWAERFARALAPLRAEPAGGGPQRSAAALPASSRLLDELGLARATPASLMARWAAATDQGQAVGGLVELVLGSGRGGPVGAELVQDGPHLLVEGPAGSGRTELLRSIAASLAAAARPDRLGLVLLDGAGGERGDGLLPAAELPHVAAHLVASDPVRMREFAQALGSELKRRAELLEGTAFADWHAEHAEHAQRALSDRMVAPRPPASGEQLGGGELDPPRTGTLRLRASAVRSEPVAGPTPLPRLVVLVDDYDALVAPALGSAGRPAAGSVVRALEAVARDGARLGVHLVAASARPDRTADTELARSGPLRVELDAPDRPGPGRGRLRFADGTTVPFQGGRVTGRIPRTATLRPTVVPLEWDRMGDPPARRPVRELGNGPTDLALLASALDRASHLVSAIPVLFPAAP